MGRRLYFHPEGRRATNYLALKNPLPLAGIEAANRGFNGKNASLYTVEDDCADI
jgi:hypothetical protein